MMGYVEVIRGVDCYRTELSPKGIGGPACKKRSKSMLKSVINAKDLL